MEYTISRTIVPVNGPDTFSPGGYLIFLPERIDVAF
jgi:hypothetical protein